MSILNGLTVIVTGGTGALGRAVVDVFLQQGARVVVPSRGEEGLKSLRASHANDDRLLGEKVDTGDEDGMISWLKSINDRCNGIDALVNCAGGWAGGKPVHETPWSVWQQQIDANLKTAVIACHATIPHLVARGGGAIVNVSSRAATQPSANSAAYAASKRALVQLTEALAAELRASHVTANVLLPLLIDTPSNRAAGMTKGAVDPAAIARVAAFLVSVEGRVVSGAAIPV